MGGAVNLSECLPLNCLKSPKAAEMYLCGVCKGFPSPATAFEHQECDRLFCKSCWQNMQSRKSACPNCNAEVKTLLQIKSSNKILYRLMGQQQIVCPIPSESEKCPWEGSCAQLEDHLKSCPNVILDCTQDCKQKCPRKHFLKHLNQDCPNRPRPCIHCGLVLSFKEMPIHLTSCTSNPDAECPCAYMKYGCSYKGKQLDRKKHEANDHTQHLQLVYNRGCKLNEELKALDPEGRKRNAARSILEQAFNNNFKVPVHPHPLHYIVKDNGWACDGRKLPGGCARGITGFHSTSGVPRYRCDPCDFDLCDRCMEKHL